MWIIAGILLGGYLFSRLLSFVNVSYLRRKASEGLPEELRGRWSPEQIAMMVEYNRAQDRLGRYSGALVLAGGLGLLFSGFLPHLAGWLAATSLPLWLQGLAALALPGFLLYLAGVPGSLASHFGVEKRFGFSTITWRTWLMDQVKSLLLSGFLLGLLFLGFYWAIGRLGHWWWLAAWSLVVVFSLLVTLIAPIWLAPLFNRFQPISDQELKEKMLEMAKRAQFPLAGVMQMDASRRSTHDNTYFTGLGTSRRIVFFDTMLRDYTPGELLAVLGHEIGHWKLGHIPRMLAASSFLSGLVLFLTARVLQGPWLYSAIGIADIYAERGLSGPAVGLALLVASMLFSPLGLLLSPLTSWLSRRHEYQADAYSLKIHRAPEDLKNALYKLVGRNLSNLFPHPLYAAFHYSHPPLLARLKAIDKLVP